MREHHVAGDTNLGGVANTSEVRGITQMAQRRLGTWRENNKSEVQTLTSGEN